MAIPQLLLTRDNSRILSVINVSCSWVCVFCDSFFTVKQNANKKAKFSSLQFSLYFSEVHRSYFSSTEWTGKLQDHTISYHIIYIFISPSNGSSKQHTMKAINEKNTIDAQLVTSNWSAHIVQMYAVSDTTCFLRLQTSSETCTFSYCVDMPFRSHSSELISNITSQTFSKQSIILHNSADYSVGRYSILVQNFDIAVTPRYRRYRPTLNTTTIVGDARTALYDVNACYRLRCITSRSNEYQVWWW
jgi:hypothetical protein